jgi:hypothetical protein
MGFLFIIFLEKNAKLSLNIAFKRRFRLVLTEKDFIFA